MAVQKNGDVVKLDTSLETCLKTALTALCREKPQEPVKWLAHWLLEHNPNAPKVIPPSKKSWVAADNTNSSITTPAMTTKEPPEIVKARAGVEGTALVKIACTDSMYADVGFHMPGVSDFTFMPAYRVGGVGPCDITGLGHVIHALGQGTSGRASRVVWISLINSPWVYINGSPYTLRAISDKQVTMDPSTGDQLQVMEEMLKADVQTEIGNEHGRLLVQEVACRGAAERVPARCIKPPLVLASAESLSTQTAAAEQRRREIAQNKSNVE